MNLIFCNNLSAIKCVPVCFFIYSVNIQMTTVSLVLLLQNWNLISKALMENKYNVIIANAAYRNYLTLER